MDQINLLKRCIKSTTCCFFSNIFHNFFTKNYLVLFPYFKLNENFSWFLKNEMLSHPFLPTHLGTPSVVVWLLSSWLSCDEDAASHWSVAASHDPVLASHWLSGLCRPWVKLLVEILSCLDRSGYLTIQIHFYYLQMKSDSYMFAKVWKSRYQVILQVHINFDKVRAVHFEAK